MGIIPVRKYVNEAPTLYLILSNQKGNSRIESAIAYLNGVQAKKECLHPTHKMW